MSAWICSPAHIGLLAAWYCDHKQPGMPMYEPDEVDVATFLAQENVRSIECRYPDQATQDEPEMIGSSRQDYYKRCAQKAKRIREMGDTKQHPLFVMKQASCFDYQACECEDYMESLAAQITYELERLVQIQLGPAFMSTVPQRADGSGKPDWNRLKEYDNAPWGIDDHPE